LGHTVDYRMCDHEVAGLNVTCGCCVPIPTQCVIPKGWLVSTSISSAVNGHTMQYPYPRSARFSCVQLKVNEMEITATLWTTEAWLTF